MRSREQDLAGLVARLASLEEIDAARTGYGDAARLVLASAAVEIGHLGSVADYLEVDARHERAVEACLGDLLQHVIVRTHQHAAAGLDFVRRETAGRCSFLVLESGGPAPGPAALNERLAGLVPLDTVLTTSGPYADSIRAAIGRIWIAESFDEAAQAAGATGASVVTVAGDVFHGGCLVTGGDRAEARGILATKREIKELRDRIEAERNAVGGLAVEIAALDSTISQAVGALADLSARFHEQEKAILGFDLQLARANEEIERLARKADLLATERRQADEERRGLEERQVEAREFIARLETEQKEADERFDLAQRALQAAREAAQERSQRAAEARAVHAGLKERAAGLAVEAGRLEEASNELESRF
jgi:chromosome segregation protein